MFLWDMKEKASDLCVKTQALPSPDPGYSIPDSHTHTHIPPQVSISPSLNTGKMLWVQNNSSHGCLALVYPEGEHFPREELAPVAECKRAPELII